MCEYLWDWRGSGEGWVFAWKEKNVIRQSLNSFQKEKRPRRKFGLVCRLAPQMWSQTDSISIPWELVRNTKPQAPPQTHRIHTVI